MESFQRVLVASFATKIKATQRYSVPVHVKIAGAKIKLPKRGWIDRGPSRRCVSNIDFKKNGWQK